MRPKRRSPEIVLRDGKPAAVILDIAEYKEILERFEDGGDLKVLKEMRKKPLKFRRLPFKSKRFLSPNGTGRFLF